MKDGKNSYLPSFTNMFNYSKGVITISWWNNLSRIKDWSITVIFFHGYYSIERSSSLNWTFLLIFSKAFNLFSIKNDLMNTIHLYHKIGVYHVLTNLIDIKQLVVSFIMINMNIVYLAWYTIIISLLNIITIADVYQLVLFRFVLFWWKIKRKIPSRVPINFIYWN